MEYSNHFREMLKERAIRDSWVELTLSKPGKVEEHKDGTRHFLCRIPEHGNKWLRVIISVEDEPHKAVTAFFDRRMREKT